MKLVPSFRDAVINVGSYFRCRTMTSLRCVRYSLTLIALTVCYAMLRRLYTEFVTSKSVDVANGGRCVVPELEPFTSHDSLTFRGRQEWKCSSAQPSLVKVIGDELVIDLDAFKDPRRDIANRLRHCQYEPIRRGNVNVTDVPDDGYTIDHDRRIEFVDRAKIDHELIYVTCLDRNRNVIFESFHAAILNKTFNRPIRKHTRPRPNVLLVGIDSVSRLNFLRHFPRSSTILRKVNAIDFKGYNKVDQNTLVNMMPLLSGRPFVDDVIDATYFDDFDLVWKEYSEYGYRTLFAEDGPRIGMFNYGNNGFREVPTDYYMRPLTVALDTSGLKKRSRRMCIDDKLEAEMVLDWMHEFVRTFKTERYFGLGYVTTLTHDDVNDAGYADYPLERFLSRLYPEDGKLALMNNTVLVLFSDHGIQTVDDVLQDTYRWQLEERMPFLYVIVPPSIDKRNLELNSRRLTTPFDVHETLLDVIGVSGRPTHMRGISLLSSIVPVNRSCEDAGIPVHYCSCHRYQPISIDDDRIRKAANAMIGSINVLTAHARDICAELTLKKIVVSQVRVVDWSTDTVFYRLSVMTAPNDGLYEATVHHIPEVGSYDVTEGGVSRINRYHNQSECVASERLILPFCYCIVTAQ